MKETIYNKLAELIAIESVSTDPKRRKAVYKAADFLKAELQSLGCKVTIMKSNNVPPLVIGQLYVNPNSRTFGIYGHYDVQPEDPMKQWLSPPFKLTRRNGKLFARGVADTKGHVIQNIEAVRRLVENNKLRNNIVFIFEGGEEINSDGFEEYAKKAPDIFSKIDVFYIVDLGMQAKNQPSIYFGLRGIVTFELDIKIGETDLHSGVYGNRVFNPIHVIGQLITQIKDLKTNKVLIPGFYDGVRKPTKRELSLLRAGYLTVAQEAKKAQTYKIITIDNVHPSIVTKIMPSLDFNGVTSGYAGEGFKTVIGATATLKFSCRLVANQTPADIVQKVTKFIKQIMPEGVKYHLAVESQAAPVLVDINNRYVKKTAAVFESVFGNKTRYTMTGGSIPAAEILHRLYHKPMLLIGFTLPDNQIHAPNENFDEEMFWKGIDVLAAIYSQI